MIPKPIHFISGLPRSGSTLLANVLAQNPRFHTTATSGVLEILYNVRNSWDSLGEFQAMSQEDSHAAKLRVLRSILFGFHANSSGSVIFDKSRSWLAYLEMAELILGRQAKVLVPVRDIREVLSSFEKLWRSTSAFGQISQEAKHFFEFQTVEGRCAVWTRGDQPVGLAYNRIKDALQRGFRDRLHFVSYEKLTTSPEQTIANIYSFLNEPLFAHDFANVQQVTKEDDRIHGFVNLHQIRPVIHPQPLQWPAILGEAAKKYAGLSLWE